MEPFITGRHCDLTSFNSLLFFVHNWDNLTFDPTTQELIWMGTETDTWVVSACGESLSFAAVEVDKKFLLILWFDLQWYVILNPNTLIEMFHALHNIFIQFMILDIRENNYKRRHHCASQTRARSSSVTLQRDPYLLHWSIQYCNCRRLYLLYFFVIRQQSNLNLRCTDVVTPYPT